MRMKQREWNTVYVVVLNDTADVIIGVVIYYNYAKSQAKGIEMSHGANKEYPFQYILLSVDLFGVC